MIWYFIEGVNCRIKDDDFSKLVIIKSIYVTTLKIHKSWCFIKAIKTGRWWIEIPFLSNVNNKLKKHTLLPCTHQDYLDACNGIKYQKDGIKRIRKKI